MEAGRGDPHDDVAADHGMMPHKTHISTTTAQVRIDDPQIHPDLIFANEFQAYRFIASS